MAILQATPSRRGFLTTLAAGSTLLCSRSLDAQADTRLAQVLERTISIDLHSHVGIPFGKPNAPLPRFDLPGEMKRTGFSAVIQTYEVDSVPAAAGEDYRHNLEALDFEDRLLAASHVSRAYPEGPRNRARSGPTADHPVGRGRPVPGGPHRTGRRGVQTRSAQSATGARARRPGQASRRHLHEARTFGWFDRFRRRGHSGV